MSADQIEKTKMSFIFRYFCRLPFFFVLSFYTYGLSAANFPQFLKSLAPNDLSQKIDQGYELRARDAEGNTILHGAVKAKRADLVKVLISRGVLMNTFDKHGLLPFHVAVQEGDIEIMQAFLDAPGESLSGKTGPASSWYSLELEGAGPLHIAAFFKQKPAFDVLLRHEIDLGLRNARGTTVFTLALEYNEAEMIEAIVKSAINKAIACSDPESSNLLFNKAIAILSRFASKNLRVKNSKNNPKLIIIRASERAKSMAVQYPGAEQFQAIWSGETTLHRFIYTGHWDSAKNLVSQGAPYDIPDPNGDTALRLALASWNEALALHMLVHLLQSLRLGHP